MMAEADFNRCEKMSACMRGRRGAETVARQMRDAKRDAMKLGRLAVLLMLVLPQAWAQDPTSACMARLAGDASLHALAQKTPLAAIKTVTLPMLADTSKPDAADKLLLEQWNAQLKACYALGQAFREHTVTPESKAILDAQQHALIALVAQLYAGALSYGEFNRGRQESYDQFAGQASASAQKMFDTRSAIAQRAQQAAMDAQRQAADSQDGTAINPVGRQLMNNDGYPSAASDALVPSTGDTSGIAAAACEKAGLGPACTGK